MSEMAVLMHRDYPLHVFVIMPSVFYVMEYIKHVDMIERPEKWVWTNLDRNTFVCNGYIIKRCEYYNSMLEYNKLAGGDYDD